MKTILCISVDTENGYTREDVARDIRALDASMVIDPEGNRPLSLEEAASTQAFRVAREGFYELRRANDRNEMIAVFADRREADLALAPQETLQLWQNTGEGSMEAAAVIESVRKPWNLWWYVLLLALAAAIAESLLAGRYLSIDRGAE